MLVAALAGVALLVGCWNDKLEIEIENPKDAVWKGWLHSFPQCPWDRLALPGLLGSPKGPGDVMGHHIMSCCCKQNPKHHCELHR